jgi:hypothetical protein
VNGQELIDQAQAATGLDDFGDESFREGLDVLVGALDTEADLNDMGRAVMGGQIAACLTNRLQIEDWYRRFPEIDDQEIVAPLFGLGLPRTGSTALGNLFAEDPAFRSLRMWEATSPCPPPELATAHDDPRIAVSQARLDLQDQVLPTLRDMVPLSATGPTECLAVLAYDFRSSTFEGMARVPTYSEWLLQCDMEPGYRYHRRVLKLLQWHCPPTKWWLRTPAHMLAIDALDRVYPDARFVMTHRDVSSVIPSVASLTTTLAGMSTDVPDAAHFGAQAMTTWETALRRAIAFRDDGREDRFVDIGFRDVQSDPIGSMRGLYETLGEDLSPEAEANMAAWWAANSGESRGAHRYQAEDFGLDVEGIQERFRFYSDRFDVPLDR